MKARIDHLIALGIDTELYKYPNLGHGFGLGIGTSAEGWIDDAIAFWEKQVKWTRGEMEMSGKQKLRIGIDCAMSITMFVLMSLQYTEQKNHEIAGTVMLVLFLFHHGLNFQWYRAFGKGRHSGRRLLLTVTDAALLADMLALMVSGIAMSQYVFRFLGFEMDQELARSLHMVSSYLGFLLMGFHFGLHYSMILGMLRKALHITKENKARMWLLRGFVGSASGYGIFALTNRNFLSYITLRTHFVLFNYDEPAFLYELDLLAITVFTAFVGYYLQKLLIYKKPKQNQGE